MAAACRNPQPQVEGESCGSAHWRSKSSGETWSRNSRNFSTSSSCSSGTASPASSRTSSAPTIRLPVRSARAIESEGRALDLDAGAEDQLGVEDAVLHVGDPHLGRARCRSRRARPSSGRGSAAAAGRRPAGRRRSRWPRRRRSRSAGSGPRHLPQQHDRLVGGHLDPDSDDVDFAHAVTLLRATGPAVARTAQRRRRPALTRVACSRTESAAISLTASSARPWAAASRPRCERRDDLLDQADLAVGGGLEGAQVARLEAEVGQLARRSGRRPARRCRSGRCRARRDQAVLLELVEQLLGDLGDLEQLARESRRSLARRNDSGAGQPVGGQRDRRAPSARPASIGGGSSPRSIASRCSPMTFSGR